MSDVQLTNVRQPTMAVPTVGGILSYVLDRLGVMD